MANGIDRRDKGAFMEAFCSIPLCNKMCRATRKRLKRTTSKAVRQSLQRRPLED